jgi:hypothetical protein
MLQAPFEVSEKCCDVLKKAPFHIYNKETGLSPIVGTMAVESRLRLKKWLQHGCNLFNKDKMESYPLSIWTESDIWTYISKFNVKYSPIYDKGFKRTGCMLCGFGCHLEKGMFNRFDILNFLHPRAYQTFMNYKNNGITFREAFEYIGIQLPDSKHKQLALFEFGDYINN